MTLLHQPLILRVALCATMVSLGLLSFSPTKAPAQASGAKLEELLEYANLLFSREQYGVAAGQYRTFIQENSKSPNLQIAWFRLGECYLKVNQIDDAVTSYNFLIENFRTGPFVGSAAYRVAVLRLNAKDYQNALTYFDVARKHLNDPKAKLQAGYYHARCLQLTDQPKEALAAFDRLVKEKPNEDNPLYERGMLEKARLQFELGSPEKALKTFSELAELASTKEVKEEAIVRTGLLAAEAGQTELSEKFLNQALKFSDTSPWKNLAQTGAIFNAFAAEDYDRVIGLYQTGAYSPPEDSRAKMLLIVGHSYRIKGDLDSALRLYALVEGKYPDRTEGSESGYRRLQILHQKGDHTLPELASRFAEKQRRIEPNSQYIDMSWLMVAEWHFSKAENSASGPGSEFAKKHFGDAAEAYSRVRLDNVDEKYREVSLYKTGWAQIESGNRRDGILSLTKFLKEHPETSLASSALAKRAVAYQADEDYDYALADFQELAEKHPEAPEVEFSLQQVALIFAHQKKTFEMINAYHELLKRFPNTNGAGEARYWIGVGYFDLEQHQQAVPQLEKARDMDAEYGDKATLRLVICHYQLESIDALATEAKRYIESAPPENANAKKKRASIPPPVIEYLGMKLAANGDHERAEYFLSLISTPDDPSKTTKVIWEQLAKSRKILKKHVLSITAWDNFLLATERPSERANAYLQRGISQLCMQDSEAARNSAQESLRSQKEGRTNAEARILLGDIAVANGRLEDAAREYLVVSQIFTDPEVTPLALTKVIKAYQSLGNREKAQELQQELSKNFPNYKAPANLGYDC